MSVSLARQSNSYSSRSITSSTARSISSASAINLSGGMQLVGAGQTRISTGSFQTRAPSMYGGAGGYGTRISQSVFSSDSLTPYSETAVITDEKVTMQNLNDRLASYLEKVRTLEAANRKLELQIKEYYEKKRLGASKDFTSYFATIADLRALIAKRHSENQSIILQIDNAQLAADDFKMKYETELSIHTNVESDVSRLRGVRDNLTVSISDLQMQVEGLKEELAFMNSNHEEDKRQLKIQSGTVNVEMDSPESVDLTKVLDEMREQYEAVMLKNKMELEKWFKSKVETLEVCVQTSATEVKTLTTELSEQKRTYQSLEIRRQSILAEIHYLKQNMEETKSRYSIELSQLQMNINMLEVELQQLKVSIEQQQSEYKLLLDIKMRLELEIAEYRRLLDGDLQYEQKKAVVIVEVEEHKPHIERRVKTIVEEIIDGKVVSSTVDEKVEDIQ